MFYTDSKTGNAPSREEIEELCLIHAAQEGRGEPKRILEVLGLSREHVHLIPTLYSKLEMAGRVTMDGENVMPSADGIDWLSSWNVRWNSTPEQK